MRAVEPELQTRLNSGATQLCRCWRVSRTDGMTFGFTDHDHDLHFDGQLFRASSGMDASALESATGLSVDNAQALGALSDAAVREEDVRSGRFDRALIEHWLVDWERPELRVQLFRGEFGEIRRADGAFEVELRGLAERLNIPVGRSILRSCDRILGDAKCCVEVGRPEFSAEAAARGDSRGTRMVAAGLGEFAPGWFTQGTLTWVAGANAGLGSVIKVDTQSSEGLRLLDLWQQPSQEVAAGDRFRLRAGCDKRPETCRQKFSNFLNFRGFPHIPGEDWVTAYPKNGAIHDGTSQLG